MRAIEVVGRITSLLCRAKRNGYYYSWFTFTPYVAVPEGEWLIIKI